VLNEVLGVPAGIAPAVLRQKHAVGVIGPPRACSAYVVRAEALGEDATSYRAADVFDEPAHEAQCDIDRLRKVGPVAAGKLASW
jgi:hypothetical protein